jgi:hypothetical protein
VDDAEDEEAVPAHSGSTSVKKKSKAPRASPPFDYATVVGQLPPRLRQGFIVWCEAAMAAHYPEGAVGIVVSEAQQDFLTDTAGAVDAELARAVEDVAKAFARQCGFAAIADQAAFVIDTKSSPVKTCELCGKEVGNKKKVFKAAGAAVGYVLCFAKKECWCFDFVQTLHNLCWFRAYAREVIHHAVDERLKEAAEAGQLPTSTAWDDHLLFLLGPKWGKRTVDPVTHISTSSTIDDKRPLTPGEARQTVACAIGSIAYVLAGGQHMFNKLGLA